MRNEYPAKQVRLHRTEKGQFKIHIVKLLNVQSILQILSFVCMENKVHNKYRVKVKLSSCI